MWRLTKTDEQFQVPNATTKNRIQWYSVSIFFRSDGRRNSLHNVTSYERSHSFSNGCFITPLLALQCNWWVKNCIFKCSSLYKQQHLHHHFCNVLTFVPSKRWTDGRWLIWRVITILSTTNFNEFECPGASFVPSLSTLLFVDDDEMKPNYPCFDDGND